MKIRVGKSLVLIVTGILFLVACGDNWIDKNLLNLSEITIDGEVYYSDFYEHLIPLDYEFKDGQTMKKHGNEFRPVINDNFDLVHGDVGIYTSGTLYCREDQLDQAREHYKDSDNFTYYCLIGNKFERDNEVIIENIDPELFDNLYAFADENEYNPFGSNDGIEVVVLDIPTDDESPQVFFYRESKDGMFTSGRLYTFHVLDGRLLLLFYYDFNEGKKEELHAVYVPSEIGSYFVDLFEEVEGYDVGFNEED